MSALPASTANWHWKNKNVTGWGRSWFERELTTIKVEGEEGVVSISKVTDFDGDVELGQRKSKLITIYDCKIDLEWSGTTSDGTEVSGLLKIPEVSHEITLDGLSDYYYEWTLTTGPSPAVESLYSLAKKLLPTALETKFAEFPAALTEIHGKDLQVNVDESSRTGTPAPVASSSAPTVATSGPKVVKKEQKSLNTSRVTAEANFMASADDLFSTLTDEGRIPAWTRAPAKSDPVPEGAFTLFGGGVVGTYVSVDRPTKFVQKWALSSPQWPSGHEATLTTSLEQSSDSTKLTLTLDGVPSGLEDETRRNLEGYYIHGLKSIGLGTVL